MGKNKYKSDIIEGMFESIIPEGLIGEQYTKDVALVFKPEDVLISTKTKYQKVDIVKTDYWGQILFLDNLLMKTEKYGETLNEMIIHPIMNTGRKKEKVLVN